MVEYIVNLSSVPCSVALFTCDCGASTVDYDLRQDHLPPGWSPAEDGSPRCPRCSKPAENHRETSASFPSSREVTDADASLPVMPRPPT
jgi:hypothetical protein